MLIRLCFCAAFAVATLGAGACSDSSSRNGSKSVDYYAKLTSQVNKLYDQNRQIIDRNLRQDTPAVHNDGSQATDEAVIRKSYDEFVANVDAFADSLESIEPPSIAMTAQLGLVAASRELARVDRRSSDLFDSSHTPVETDTGLVADSERSTREWQDACRALEALVTSSKAPPSHLPCSEAVQQDSAGRR